MRDVFYNYLLVFLVACFSAYFFTPLVIKLALKVKALDHPDERKVHTRPVPTLGGIAIFGSFYLTLAVYFILLKFLKISPVLENSPWLLGIFFGGLVILLFGLLDDIFLLSPAVKFVGQVIAAAVLIYFGVKIEFLGLPYLGVVSLSNLIAVPLTLLWVVGLMNTINFIDGLDGLAAGVCGIALITFALSAYATGRLDIALFCVALAGSNFGFLRYNFNPARIFMGDSGSMFLGFMLGALTVQGVMKSIAAVALLVPIVIMAIPLFDAVFAIFRRVKSAKPLTQADQDHIHHRLLKRGFTHRQTVIIIYLWSFLLSAVAILFMFPFARLAKIGIFMVLLVASVFLARYSGVFDWLGKAERREKV